MREESDTKYVADMISGDEEGGRWWWLWMSGGGVVLCIIMGQAWIRPNADSTVITATC